MANGDPTDEAIAAANAAVAAALASASEGEANANLAYSLSQQILDDGQFEAIIPLDMLVARIITEGLQAYERVAVAAASATAQCQSDSQSADAETASLFDKYSAELAKALGGSR